MRNLASNVLLIAGLFAFIGGLYLLYQRERPANLTFKSSPAFQVKSKATSKLPVYLDIGSANIHVSIYPARVDHNTWETTDKGVSWMTRSPMPGDKGNSILYGHNWKSILGNLSQVKEGNELVIRYSDGTSKKFKAVSKKVVNPDDISILDQSDDLRITLYTCTGFLDMKRLVVVLKII